MFTGIVKVVTSVILEGTLLTIKYSEFHYVDGVVEKIIPLED